jgi:hypothetical protein
MKTQEGGFGCADLGASWILGFRLDPEMPHFRCLFRRRSHPAAQNLDRHHHNRRLHFLHPHLRFLNHHTSMRYPARIMRRWMNHSCVSYRHRQNVIGRKHSFHHINRNLAQRLSSTGSTRNCVSVGDGIRVTTACTTVAASITICCLLNTINTDYRFMVIIISGGSCHHRRWRSASCSFDGRWTRVGHPTFIFSQVYQRFIVSTNLVALDEPRHPDLLRTRLFQEKLRLCFAVVEHFFA